MNKEYVIIDKTVIQKRIERLGKLSKKFYFREGIDEYDFAKEELEGVLSQSTPLIPEIEKAFDAGKQAYISNLKLDI